MRSGGTIELGVSTRRVKDGAVFTKDWVVDLILDLASYAPERPLAEMLLVEPSAGDGSFLIGIVTRLIRSCQLRGQPIIEAKSALIAYELDEGRAAQARSALRRLLSEQGVGTSDATSLVDSWVQTGDYLLEARRMGSRADFVVGNPPYIRLEDMERGGAVYRSHYRTMVGRADVYVAFFEAALRQLRPTGVCGFICADRWMFNQYGSELRRLITSGFSVEAVLQMHHADAFESEVSAYPAVTIIRRAMQTSTVVASLEPDAEHIGAKRLVEQVRGAGVGSAKVTRIEQWFKGSAPWPLLSPAKLALLRRIECEFSPIEGTSATVGIGVATGADRVFITKDPDLVEPDRLLPMAMASDAKGHTVKWSGNYLVNPWNGGGLVNLALFPKLAEYFASNKDLLNGRHVSKKSPTNWFRTIDRVDTTLVGKSKLYLPDINGRIAPVLDRGQTYPHHNLYYIDPGLWDAEVLGGLLLSNVAQFFVEAYGVRMRGGYLRFQAQYLRRICLPLAHELSKDQQELLRIAFETHDIVLANQVAAELYQLGEHERELIGD